MAGRELERAVRGGVHSKAESVLTQVAKSKSHRQKMAIVIPERKSNSNIKVHNTSALSFISTHPIKYV